jgi:hypothetical protein
LNNCSGSFLWGEDDNQVLVYVRESDNSLTANLDILAIVEEPTNQNATIFHDISFWCRPGLREKYLWLDYSVFGNVNIAWAVEGDILAVEANYGWGVKMKGVGFDRITVAQEWITIEVCFKGELAGEWEEQGYQTYLNHDLIIIETAKDLLI